MKGHTKIELKDVKTGKVQVIDEDNMVTNAIADMCKPFGISKSYSDPFCQDSFLMNLSLGAKRMFL